MRPLRTVRPTRMGFPVIAIAVLGVLRLVYLSYPVGDLLARQDPLAWIGGWPVIVVIITTQVVLSQRILGGGVHDLAMRALAVSELTLGLGTMVALGQEWVGVPVFGLADALLSLRGRGLAAAIGIGMAVYVLVVAHLYDPSRLIALFSQFSISLLLLYAVPKMAISLRELDEARSEIAAHALAAERTRLARDLHDTLGQSLSVVLLKLDVASRVATRDPVRGHNELTEGRNLLRAALAEMQEVVTGLRRISLDSEILEASTLLTSAGIATTTAVDEIAVCLEAADALAWVVREGTTNVLRHSAASRCAISLRARDSRVELSITNDSPLPPEPENKSGGNGISGLRERLRSVDGELSAASSHRSFTLTATIPIRARP